MIAGLLVPITASLIFGTSSLAVIFLYLHLDHLQAVNASLGYYSTQHKKFFVFLKIMSVVCGVSFFRIIYSGLFGKSVTTEGKSLGICASFRYPLEKLCQMNAVIVAVPLVVLSVVVISVYPVVSDAWQVALFTALLNCCIYGYFLFNYYRSPWRL